MESFTSLGYKISYTKKCNPVQKCTVLFLSVSTTDVGHSVLSRFFNLPAMPTQSSVQEVSCIAVATDISKDQE